MVVILDLLKDGHLELLQVTTSNQSSIVKCYTFLSQEYPQKFERSSLVILSYHWLHLETTYLLCDHREFAGSFRVSLFIDLGSP